MFFYALFHDNLILAYFCSFNYENTTKISHYHKYTSSAEYREHYKKSFLFVHTKDTYATLQISCIWGILFSVVCCVYFFLHDTTAGIYSLIPAVLPLILLLYIRKANKKTH